MSSYRLSVLLVCLTLAGCGFQLRGAASIPPEMARIYVAAESRHSLFYRQLLDGLRQSGVEVVTAPAKATATFSIFADETGQRVLSVSARNVPREFEVFYTVEYSVETDEKTLLSLREQTLIRDYTWNEAQVLGKEKEEQLLREAIVDDLVRVVLIQLSAL